MPATPLALEKLRAMRMRRESSAPIRLVPTSLGPFKTLIAGDRIKVPKALLQPPLIDHTEETYKFKYKHGYGSHYIDSWLYSAYIGKKGFAYFALSKEEKTVYIYFMEIPRAERGKGHGTRLLRRIERIAQHNGIELMTAEVHENNIEMQRVLRREGWRPTGERLKDGTYTVWEKRAGFHK